MQDPGAQHKSGSAQCIGEGMSQAGAGRNISAALSPRVASKYSGGLLPHGGRGDLRAPLCCPGMAQGYLQSRGLLFRFEIDNDFDTAADRIAIHGSRTKMS